MIRLLAVDTATEACSAALMIGDALTERTEIAPRGHADLLLPMIEALLAEAGMRLGELDGIAFDRGPGSFTGVRIGASTVQGLAFAAGLPVFPVSSLAALAQAAIGEGWQEGALLAAIDARMGEVYWGAFDVADGLAEALGIEQVSAPQTVTAPYPGPWCAIGSGWDTYHAELAAALGRAPEHRLAGRYPQAREVALLAAVQVRHGAGLPPEAALPVYLRDEVATPPG
jgi:tRNA threonylcarbamoyladenosine biosynthesis protein TsaB